MKKFIVNLTAQEITCISGGAPKVVRLILGEACGVVSAITVAIFMNAAINNFCRKERPKFFGYHI